MLDYLESQKDHPVIQSGIVLSVLSTDGAVTEDAGVIARLVASAFLAKYGFDLRGLLTVEKNWMAQDQSYAIALRSHSIDGNLNHFLLFYAQTIEENLNERLSDLSNNKFHQDFPAAFWDLNDRQKQILAVLEEPAVSITNKKVQGLFGVSQITASRDLSKLHTLGLIIPHGKGRSVSYTRV
jgi:Fic family protein